jgi:hypothetical protein
MIDNATRRAGIDRDLFVLSPALRKGKKEWSGGEKKKRSGIATP